MVKSKNKKSETHTKEKEVVHKKKNHTERLRENPWILSTLALCFLSVVLIVVMINNDNDFCFQEDLSSTSLTKEIAGQKVFEFVQLFILSY